MPTARSTTALALVGALATTTVAGAARAETGECRAVRLTVLGAVPKGFARALVALDASMRALPKDECVAVDLIAEARANGVVLTARTSDGRTGERQVDRPDRLAAIAMGLIAAVPVAVADVADGAVARGERDDAASPPAAATAPIAPDDIPPREPLNVTRPMRLTEPLPPLPYAIGVELGAGARVLFPTRIGAPEAVVRADLRTGDWLGALNVRVTPTAIGLDAPHALHEYVEVGVGLGIGRRVHAGFVALDLALFASLTIVAQEGDPPYDGLSGVSPQFRLGPSVRLLVPTRSRFHPALTVDAEISPFTVTSPTYIDDELAPLPTFTFGAHFAVLFDVVGPLTGAQSAHPH